MDSKYDHKQYEGKIYQQWEESGAFSPTDNKDAKPFSIILPPPNANDPLHVGHAMYVVEDVLIRYHRMLGEAAEWLPGTDHAGIETQYVFEKKLGKEGKSRFDFDRETLYQMIWDYVHENSNTAIDQLKKLGFSLDWKRFKFTLNPEVVKIVLETFSELVRDGLAYRDLRLVNYCTKCGTGFSELEVNHVEQNDPLYYIKYGPFTLATVRPETKFGDTALAVNPDDKRYQEWIGKEIEAEGLLGKFKIRVIADSYVDPEFGTGVVKITPAHDPNDFAVWQRHKDEIPGPKQVIGFDGKLNALTGKYAGLNVVEGRKQVVADMQAAGMIEKIDEKYIHNVGTCYRCGRTLEPLPMPQFFIKVKPLTEKALKALDNKETIVLGAGHDKILRHWLENLNDWNISRQIVWGIRMPIWYELKNQNLEIEVGFLDKEHKLIRGTVGELLKTYTLNEIKSGLQTLRAPLGAEFMVSPTLPGENYLQETDTFDTWFSSSQWPFVTLMANSMEDFNRFYPTSVMETAYDILMFWVMRMLMMGIYKTGKAPFKVVYLHGLIRDSKGQKMSKSKGNVVNPLEVVDKYGADALRMALTIRSTPGIDKNVSDNDFRAMRNLTNKIWNAARFITMSLDKNVDSGAKDQEFSEKLGKTINEVSEQLKKYKVGLAADTTYDLFWHWFCDEAIEANKQGLIATKELVRGLVTFLKLLHPFVPFVTEAIYQELRQNQQVANLVPEEFNSEMLIEGKWPEVRS
jgi:valyl-tRNA synthetase